MPHDILEALEQHLCIECSLCKLETNVTTLWTTEIDSLTQPLLNIQVKETQEDHYTLLRNWQGPHNLTIDTNNYFWKDDALVVVEDNDLKRGVLSLFHHLSYQPHL